APAVAPPGQHAAASRPPARTATAPAPRNTPWTARKPRPQAPPRTLASGSFFPFRSSDNQERNEKEPFKHAPTQANRARNTTGGYIPSRVLTPEEPHPCRSRRGRARLRYSNSTSSRRRRCPIQESWIPPIK